MIIIRNIILSLSISVGAVIVYMMNVPRMLHFAQLENYKVSDFFRWITKHPKMVFQSEVPQLVGNTISLIIACLANYILGGRLCVADMRKIIAIECFALTYIYMLPNIHKAMLEKKKRKNAKKPLVYTGRAKRLLFWNLISLAFLEVIFLLKYLNIGEGSAYYFVKPLYYSFFTFAMPLNMILALFLAAPTERFIANCYISSAKAKLRKKDYKNLIKIGITGSYGKTSSKFILESILSQKYRVLATPESYNTTMGNVKVIREQLKPEHEVFISEMGARYRYEIEEICQFVKPTIGMITSIGPQHLETFKKVENIVRTKAELIEALPQKGVVVLPNDDSHCLKLYQKETRKKYLFSVKDKHADVYAREMKLSSQGTSFIAVTPIGEIKCTSKLLGEHNIQNILGCIAIAIELGLTKEQIAKGVEKIKPIEHRLQVLEGANGMTIIDDAFNSNPMGSQRALEVLKSFDGRKIIITPGMVELGKDEERYNREFGVQMASCVDIAILIGQQRSAPIVKGLKEKEFDEMNLYVVDSLESATEKLASIGQYGDVVLFENDLPDHYNE